MDFKNKAVNHKLFDIFFICILGFYIITIFPINIIFTYLLTKAYVLNDKNLLNCFIIEFLGFLCLSHVYFINSYNYIVKTNKFKQLYDSLSNQFPVLYNYNPEMLFENLDEQLIKLDDNNKEDGDLINNSEDNTESNNEDEVYEVPPAEPKNLKKMFFSEVLKNPELISNMTKMMGSIDPNMIDNITKSMKNSK
jgi:hypothetical protein